MQFGIEEILKSNIKIYDGLLQGDGIGLSQPTIPTAFLGYGQQWFQVLSGGQILIPNLVPVRPDCQSLVPDEAHCTELTVQKFRLLQCRVDSYVGGS